jgi:hypothetical protein
MSQPKFICGVVSQSDKTQQIMVAKAADRVWRWVLTASIGRTYTYDDNAWLQSTRRKVNERLYENRKLVPEHWTDLHACDVPAPEPEVPNEVPNEVPEVELHPNGAPVRYREKDGRLLCKTIDCPWLPRVNGFCNACKTGM